MRNKEIMIKFEFTLSDIDAENFIRMFDDEMARIGMLIILQDDDSTLQWYKRHIEYLKQMKQTILAGNTRIEGAE